MSIITRLIGKIDPGLLICLRNLVPRGRGVITGKPQVREQRFMAAALPGGGSLSAMHLICLNQSNGDNDESPTVINPKPVIKIDEPAGPKRGKGEEGTTLAPMALPFELLRRKTQPQETEPPADPEEAPKKSPVEETATTLVPWPLGELAGIEMKRRAASLVNLAGKVLAEDNYEEAIKHCDEALALEPKNGPALNYKVLVLRALVEEALAQKDFNIAIDLCQEILAIRPGDIAALKMLLVPYVRMGRQAEAVVVFEQLLSLDYNPSQKEREEFERCQRQGAKCHHGTTPPEYEKAIEFYDQALALDPRDKNVVRDKAAALLELSEERCQAGDYQVAIEACDLLLVMIPDHTGALKSKSAALCGIGLKLCDEGEEAAGMQRVEEALVTYPDKDALMAKAMRLQTQAWQCFQQGQYEEALGYFRQSAKLDPSDGSGLISTGEYRTLLELVRHSLAQGDLEKVLAYLNDALKIRVNGTRILAELETTMNQILTLKIPMTLETKPRVVNALKEIQSKDLPAAVNLLVEDALLFLEKGTYLRVLGAADVDLSTKLRALQRAPEISLPSLSSEARQGAQKVLEGIVKQADAADRPDLKYAASRAARAFGLELREIIDPREQMLMDLVVPSRPVIWPADQALPLEIQGYMAGLYKDVIGPPNFSLPVVSGYPDKTVDGLQELGDLEEGGYGSVTLCYHPQYGYVAKKVIRPGIEQEDPDALERFEREMRLLDRLSHPNILRLFERGTDNSGNRYFLSEYMAGFTLRAYFGSPTARSFSVPHTLTVIYLLCLALQEAERKVGVVHRDLNPGNIILTVKPQRVQIGDFGAAKAVNELERPDLTKQWHILGVPSYVPPEVWKKPTVEQRTEARELARASGKTPDKMAVGLFLRALMAGSAVLDSRADVYALSLLGFKMLTGKLPREFETGIAGYLQHFLWGTHPDPKKTTFEKDHLAQLPGRAGEAVRQLLMDMGQRNVNKRIGDYDKILERIRGILETDY